MGTIRGFQAKIHVDSDVKPLFHRARSVPYSIREIVEEELQRLQEEGFLEPVEMADWAAPIVPVLKQDKKRYAVTFSSCTVNPVSKLDKYPIPRVEDIFANLQGAKYFTELDLRQVYQQLPLLKESQKLVVINTVYFGTSDSRMVLPLRWGFSESYGEPNTGDQRRRCLH